MASKSTTNIHNEAQKLAALLKQRDTQLAAVKAQLNEGQLEKTRLQEISEEMSSKISSMEAQMQETIQRHKREIAELKYHNVNMEYDLHESEQDNRATRLHLVKNNTEVDSLKEQVELLQLEIETTKAERDRLVQQKDGYEERVKEVSVHWQQTHGAYNADIQGYQSKVDSLKKQLEEQTARNQTLILDSVEKERILNSEIQDAQRLVLDFKKKFNSAERELETLREQDSSTHTKERSQVEKLQKQIQGLKEKHETDLQEKDKEIAQAQKQIKKMKDAHEEALKKKEEEIKKKDAELKHASDKQATLKQKLKETESAPAKQKVAEKVDEIEEFEEEQWTKKRRTTKTVEPPRAQEEPVAKVTRKEVEHDSEVTDKRKSKKVEERKEKSEDEAEPEVVKPKRGRRKKAVVEEDEEEEEEEKEAPKKQRKQATDKEDKRKKEHTPEETQPQEKPKKARIEKAVVPEKKTDSQDKVVDKENKENTAATTADNGKTKRKLYNPYVVPSLPFTTSTTSSTTTSKKMPLPLSAVPQIKSFLLTPTHTKLRLPHLLTNEERKAIHLWCEDTCGGYIEHESYGYNKKRHLVLTKAEGVDPGELVSFFSAVCSTLPNVPEHQTITIEETTVSAPTLVSTSPPTKLSTSKSITATTPASRATTIPTSNATTTPTPAPTTSTTVPLIAPAHYPRYKPKAASLEWERYKKESEKRCLIESLPVEVISVVLGYCDCVSLSRLACSSTFFMEATSDEVLWKDLCKSVYTSMYSSIVAQQLGEAEETQVVKSMTKHTNLKKLAAQEREEQKPLEPHSENAEFSWKFVYMQRFNKQKKWDSKKQKPPKQASTSNPELAASASSSTRQKNCKRCWQRYDPNNNAENSCRYHSGIFAHREDCTTCEGLNENSRVSRTALSDAIGRKVRHSASKRKENYTFVSAYGECQFQYTCCGAVFSGAEGCHSARHK